MKYLCAVLLLVASATSLNTSNRIVGGQPATIQQHPYQVGLLHFDRYYCGGALVKPNKVLTAAHCLLKYTAPETFVRAGATDYRYGGTKLGTSYFIIHPEYRRDTKMCDIGVMTLANSFQLGATISTIALVGIGKKPQPGSMMTVAGWGRTQFSPGGASPTLNAITLPVIGNVPCDAAYDQPNPPHVTDKGFCIGDGRTGPYLGDSGSAVVNVDRQLAGIMAWGSTDSINVLPYMVTDLCHPVVRRFVDDNL